MLALFAIVSSAAAGSAAAATVAAADAPSADPYFPGYFPRMHAGHNNDVNGPFFFRGRYHLFLQQDFPWLKPPAWNGAIGWGHLVSDDLARWSEVSAYNGHVDAFVPGRWHDPRYGVPSGGYYSGSVTLVDGVPIAVFPSYFANGSCYDPWDPKRPAGPPTCVMEYQYSTPTNLSDPLLANWSQPKTLVPTTAGMKPHDVVFEDPSAAWLDPTTPGRWVFIGQTDTGPPSTKVGTVLLEAWGSKNGSHWEDGFESLGDFFPGTHDSRCAGHSCGYFTPSFANGRKLNGYNVLWGGNDQYWLGTYDPAPNSTQQKFVPSTMVQNMDGPESSCPKGFFDASTNRYLIWFWVGAGLDGVVNKGRWDGMLSVAMVVDVDLDLLSLTLFPVEELASLRTPIAIPNTLKLPSQGGEVPLAGVASRQLDLVITFSWDLPAVPQCCPGVLPCPAAACAAAEEVGVLVGVGAAAAEQTKIGFVLTPGLQQFCNATRKQLPAVMMVLDTTKSRRGVKVKGNVAQKPVSLKPGEASLSLRVLVDNSVIQAFVQDGRASMTRRFYPTSTASSGAALYYKPAKPTKGGAPLPPPRVTVRAYEMAKE